MIRVELIGGPSGGLEGFVTSPPEVQLVKSEDGFVDAYEREEGWSGLRKVRYLWVRCVGKLGGTPEAVECDGHRPPLQGKGGAEQ